MSKNNNNQQYKTATPQEIWKKFDDAEKIGTYFEYECFNPDTNMSCVRSTILGYCEILTQEEARKRMLEMGDDVFYPIVSNKTGKPFSSNYDYYMLDESEEHAEYFAVRKRGRS